MTSCATFNNNKVDYPIIVDFCFVETKRPRDRLFCENDSREIRLLQKFDQAMCHGRVVPNDVKQNRPAIADQHDISFLRFAPELSHCSETGFVQDLPKIDRVFDRGEAMIGHDKYVGSRAYFFLNQRRNNRDKIIVRGLDRG